MSFIGEEPSRLATFLDQTGLRPDTLRSAAADSRFLGRVVEFIRDHEDMARQFCEAHALDARSLATVHELLVGPQWERDVP